jgi:hypothetical protein
MTRVIDARGLACLQPVVLTAEACNVADEVIPSLITKVQRKMCLVVETKNRDTVLRHVLRTPTIEGQSIGWSGVRHVYHSGRPAWSWEGHLSVRGKPFFGKNSNTGSFGRPPHAHRNRLG